MHVINLKCQSNKKFSYIYYPVSQKIKSTNDLQENKYFLLNIFYFVTYMLGVTSLNKLRHFKKNIFVLVSERLLCKTSILIKLHKILRSIKKLLIFLFFKECKSYLKF